MKKILLATLIVFFLVSPPVFARGWRGHRGGVVAAGVLGGLATGILLDRLFVPYYPAPVYYGYDPWSYPYYSYPAPAPYPYYGPAPVIAAQPAPQAYQQPQQQYWYWCENPQGYYPYVQECPSNWKQVLPQTSPPKK